MRMLVVVVLGRASLPTGRLDNVRDRIPAMHVAVNDKMGDVVDGHDG